MKKNNTIEIEGLIFALNPKAKQVNFVLDQYICVIRNGKEVENREIIIEAKKSILINKPLTKVICKYQNKDLFNSKVNIAILNKPIGNNYSNDWLKKINYQRASKIDSIKTKKLKSLAHCAYLSNENLDEIQNWILNQKELGIQKIRFYFKNREIIN